MPYSNEFTNLAEVILRERNLTKIGIPEGKAAFTFLVSTITNDLREIR